MLKKLTLAQYIFLGSIYILYLVNIFLNIHIWSTTFWDVLAELLWPVAAVAALWYLRWERKPLPLFMTPVRKPVVWNCLMVALAGGLAFLLHDPEDIGILPSVMPVFSLCAVPYLYGHDPSRAMTALVTSSLVLLVASTLRECNTAATVVIALTTVALLWSFPSMDWWYARSITDSLKKELQRKSLIASLIFLSLIFTFARTPLFEDAFRLAALGRPALCNTSRVNQQCIALFNSAGWFGEANMDLGTDSFQSRSFAAVLAHFGWLYYGSTVASTVAMLASGAYLTYHTFSLQKFYVTGAYCLIAVQTVGAFLQCCGIDTLLFPMVTPFMAQDFLTNLFYLWLCALIIKPRQYNSLDKAD